MFATTAIHFLLIAYYAIILPHQILNKYRGNRSIDLLDWAVVSQDTITTSSVLSSNMIFNKRQIFSFLALIACTESFTTTTTTTSSFVSNYNPSPGKSCILKFASNQIRHTFGLGSIAEDAGSTETSESDEETEVGEENDVAVTEEENSEAVVVETPKSEDDASVAEESSGESNKQSDPEDDITKIAYVVNLSYGV